MKVMSTLSARVDRMGDEGQASQRHAGSWQKLPSRRRQAAGLGEACAAFTLSAREACCSACREAVSALVVFVGSDLVIISLLCLSDRSGATSFTLIPITILSILITLLLPFLFLISLVAV